jgi:hypothetical protein
MRNAPWKRFAKEKREFAAGSILASLQRQQLSKRFSPLTAKCNAAQWRRGHRAV